MADITVGSAVMVPLEGIAIRVFEDGRYLVELGTLDDRDVRAFDAGDVRLIEAGYEPQVGDG